ncbi:MAG: type II toxin-antitoxin system HicA family toxin [Bacteroidota bacterium]|nr:type II toxin-antitoxin system HicA family toxin [Bacteroidota bacterium]
MKTPRNLTGRELVCLLATYGYSITRQSGSHIRLSTEQNGVHHITIPDHNPLSIGTLSSILNDIALHFDISKKDLSKHIFE